jgi:hypothetical protein
LAKGQPIFQGGWYIVGISISTSESGDWGLRNRAAI